MSQISVQSVFYGDSICKDNVSFAGRSLYHFTKRISQNSSCSIVLLAESLVVEVIVVVVVIVVHSKKCWAVYISTLLG